MTCTSDGGQLAETCSVSYNNGKQGEHEPKLNADGKN